MEEKLLCFSVTQQTCLSLFNGCTSYELWDTDHFEQYSAQTERAWDTEMVRKHYCSFWLGGFQGLEADKHLGWSWPSLMFEDEDLDVELEPMQTCQAGYFEVTHRGTFFFFLGSTVSKQLFISAFITEPVFAKWFKVEHSDLSCWVFHCFSKTGFFCVHPLHTDSTYFHPCVKSSLYRGL